jgi:hypothetical protein
MQPYLFPYIGYFQLIAASDLFVVYDDVQYMKGGWVNRNRIQVNGAATWLTLPVEKASYRESIAARRYVDDPAVRHRLVKTIELAYGSAPHFAATMPLVREILLARHASVAASIRSRCSASAPTSASPLLSSCPPRCPGRTCSTARSA